MLKFKIEQIAIAPKDPARALEFLKAIGAEDWVSDVVTARGKVFNMPGGNTANLHFNYDMFGGKEFEVLDYHPGNPNWIDVRDGGARNTVTHLGMHCTAAELRQWKDKFEIMGVQIAQEVFTIDHTNPFLVENGRKYNYCIFDTKEILGVDLKFIVRIEK